MPKDNTLQKLASARKELETAQAQVDKLKRLVDSLEAKAERQGALPPQELLQLSSTLVSAIGLGLGTLLSTGALDAYRNRNKIP